MAGFHYRFSVNVGARMGNKVAKTPSCAGGIGASASVKLPTGAVWPSG
jgi:hypothetical protein